MYTKLTTIQRDGDKTISFEEFRNFLLLLPEVNTRALFESYVRTSIDIGENSIVPDDLSSHPTPPWKILVAGSVSGAISRTATAPMDRIKVMLQAGKAGGAPPGGGFVATVSHVYRTGGIKSFWRGNGVNVLKVAPEGFLKFFLWDRLKGVVAADPHNLTIPERLVSGALAGAISSTVIYPLEIAKTRLALQKPGTFSGLTDCLVKTARSGGTRELYAGLRPSLIGIIPYSGIDLATFSLLKEAYIRKFPDDEPGALVFLGCGALSSTCGQLVAYPLQVIRTRLQADGLGGATKQYSGALDCARQILASRGVGGFYSGLLPNMGKSLPAISISFAAYNMALKYLGAEM